MTRLASPPWAGSRHSAGFSALSSPSAASGSARLETNSSVPSGRNRGLPSPSADRVSRAGRPPAASIRQMLVTYFFLSGLSDWTVAASQLPSGDSRRPVIRGMAT